MALADLPAKGSLFFLSWEPAHFQICSISIANIDPVAPLDKAHLVGGGRVLL